MAAVDEKGHYPKLWTGEKTQRDLTRIFHRFWPQASPCPAPFPIFAEWRAPLFAAADGVNFAA